MARISQFEFASGDSYEIALTPDEYTDYLAGTLNLSIAHYTNDGMLMLASGVPVTKDLTLANTTDHGYDPDTNEYVISTSAPGGNWNPLPGGGGRYQGYSLYSDDGTTTTVWDARYEALTTADVSQYELVAQNGPIAGTTLTFDNHSVSGAGNSSIYDQTTGGIAYRQGNDAFGDAGTGIPCFGKGTLIGTPDGQLPVEDLRVGQMVNTLNFGPLAILWVGSKTASLTPSTRPVRFRKNSIGNNSPHTDLIVTGDHGMVIDGLIINASTLVNGTSIDWVPISEMAEQLTVYHVETKVHDAIFANGAASETFLDAPSRQIFDNFQEYLDMYGSERLIVENQMPRISSKRLLPQSIRDNFSIPCEATLQFRTDSSHF